jgi:dihydrofolate reductase
MHIHLIWAQDTNAAIGKSGTLPWHFSEDLKFFKKLTTGHTIVMGRKTWDSLPVKPLPNRHNIVISSKDQSKVDSYTSIESCIEDLKKNNLIKDVFIIGGMSVYKYFYKYAQTLHITFIDRAYPDTDTFFPINIDQIKSDFKCVSSNQILEELSFTEWTRK